MRCIALASLTMLLLYGGPAEAKEKSSSSLVVGFINVDWFPFHYEEGQRIKGFSIDVVAAVLKQMRREVEFRPTPFSAGLSELKNGEMDAYFGLGKNLSRIEQFHYSDTPLYVDETVLVGKVDDDFKFNGDVSSLIGSRVGIIKGAIHGPAFDNMNGIIRVPHDSGKVRTAQFFHDLEAGDYRFIVVNARAGATHYLRNLGLQNKLRIYREPVAIKSYFLVFSKRIKNFEKISRRFNRVHKLFRSTAEYDALLEKYNLSRKLFPR